MNLKCPIWSCERDSVNQHVEAYSFCLKKKTICSTHANNYLWRDNDDHVTQWMHNKFWICIHDGHKSNLFRVAKTTIKLRIRKRKASDHKIWTLFFFLHIEIGQPYGYKTQFMAAFWNLITYSDQYCWTRVSTLKYIYKSTCHFIEQPTEYVWPEFHGILYKNRISI